MQTRFILIHTSHAGNVGACARAMKVMGFGDLVLVAPRWENVLRRDETIQRASGALDVLNNARIVQSLDEALDGVTHLCATAMTPRDFGPPTRSPRAHFEQLLQVQSNSQTLQKTEQYAHIPYALQPGLTGKIGLLFGSERYGMRNQDVYRCHVCLSIPTDPNFGSLNMAAALQVIAYEWRIALGGFGPQALDTVQPVGAVPLDAASALINVKASAHRPVAHVDPPADARQVAGLLAHWEQSLTQIGFLDPAAPKKLLPRLNQLFNRAGVTQDEVDILRGIAKAMARQPINGPSQGL